MWTHGAKLLGVEWLDKDHMALGKAVCELADRIRNSGPGEVDTLLSRLLHETRSHFTREEQAMRDYEYTRVEHHKEAHDRLLQYVEFLKDDVESRRTALDQKMIDNLWDCLNAHVAMEDRAFAKHIQWQAIDNTTSMAKTRAARHASKRS